MIGDRYNILYLYYLYISHFPSIQVLSHYIQVLHLRFDSDARQLHALFSLIFCHTVMLWTLHSTVCKAELRCTMYNVIFNPMNVYRFYCVGAVCLCNDSNNCDA